MQSKGVFITHHFSQNGRANADLLSFCLRLAGLMPIYGERINGPISSEVCARIASSRLLVAVLTRDVDLGNGRFQPSNWTIQELRFAVGNHIPSVVTIEDGVELEGGLAGDPEMIHFARDDFKTILERLVNQVKALHNDVIQPDELPERDLSDPVFCLIVRAREAARRRNWSEFLRFSEEAYQLDSGAWRAQNNVGVASVKIGDLSRAAGEFSSILTSFSGNQPAKAMAYHNLGWLTQIDTTGNPLNLSALQKEEKYYELALAEVSSKCHTRASLIQCKVLQGKIPEASELLMTSLNYRGFVSALKYETEDRGYLGHEIIQALPESRILNRILFPTCSGEDDYLLVNERLV